MNKSEAIQLLGGTQVAAANELGITSSAVSQWPDPLTPQIENRVLAHMFRKDSQKTALIGAEGAPAVNTEVTHVAS